MRDIKDLIARINECVAQYNKDEERFEYVTNRLKDIENKADYYPQEAIPTLFAEVGLVLFQEFKVVLKGAHGELQDKIKAVVKGEG